MASTLLIPTGLGVRLCSAAFATEARAAEKSKRTLDSAPFRPTIATVTNEIVAATNQVLGFRAPPPVHDWIVIKGGAEYGLIQYQKTGTFLVFHNHHTHLPFSAPISAILLFAILLLLVASIFYFVARLRDKGATAAE